MNNHVAFCRRYAYEGVKEWWNRKRGTASLQGTF